MKRYNIPGQVHFVTTRTFNSNPYFKDDVCCRILLEELEFYRHKYEFKLLGYVIMPNHIHSLVLPDGDYDVSNNMKSIKLMTAKRIKRYKLFNNYSGNWVNSSGSLGDVTQATQGQKFSQSLRVWQNGFYEFNIYSEKKLIEKLNYIHYNPVKHGFVKNQEDWKYSSWRKYYLDNYSTMTIDKID